MSLSLRITCVSFQHGSRLSPKETDREGPTEAGRLLGTQRGKSGRITSTVFCSSEHTQENLSSRERRGGIRLWAGKPEPVDQIKNVRMTGGREGLGIWVPHSGD